MVIAWELYWPVLDSSLGSRYAVSEGEALALTRGLEQSKYLTHLPLLNVGDRCFIHGRVGNSKKTWRSDQCDSRNLATWQVPCEGWRLWPDDNPQPPVFKESYTSYTIQTNICVLSAFLSKTRLVSFVNHSNILTVSKSKRSQQWRLIVPNRKRKRNQKDTKRRLRVRENLVHD